jgi:hypothetical protein
MIQQTQKPQKEKKKKKKILASPKKEAKEEKKTEQKEMASSDSHPNDGKVHPPQQQRVDELITDRKCRDVLFLLLFIAMWAGMILVMGIALSKGDPARIVLPMDGQGNLCGRDNTVPGTRPWMDANKTEVRFDFTEKQLLYFVTPQNINASICVAACPGETTPDPLCSLPDASATFPGAGTISSADLVNATANPNCMCTYPQDPDGVVCFSRYASSAIARRCVPGDASLIGDAMASENAKVNDMVTRAFDDIQRGYKWVRVVFFFFLFLFGFGVLCSIVWLVFYRWGFYLGCPVLFVLRDLEIFIFIRFISHESYFRFCGFCISFS